MKLQIHSFELPLKETFTISRESHDVQPTLIVELNDGEHSGFGEATTNPYYDATLPNMTQAIEAQRSIVESWDMQDPTLLWAALQPHLADNPFPLCAIDQAAHDLWGKRQGASVLNLWGLANRPMPDSNYTIGIASIDEMVAKLKATPDWPIYKIKLGTENDIEIVTELRNHTNAIFRVDANCGWNVDEAIRNSHELKPLGVEFIEQPLPADHHEDQQRLFKESALPLIADESCITEQDVAQCDGLFHGINIKLVKCGGLTPARRMIDEARQRGLKTMVGCMTESTVGISAIAQLLPLLDYVDMDGAALLRQDIATGVQVIDGKPVFPDAPGHGVSFV